MQRHATRLLYCIVLLSLTWMPSLVGLLVLHHASNTTQSSCLDGTPQAFYARRGYGLGQKKWIIFFEGGSWCYDMEQCYLRSKTHLGSSSRNPQHRFTPHCMNGEARLNPMLYNWNVVYVNYCDGSSFAGDAVHTYKNTTLHFNGKANREAVIKTLADLDLRSLPCAAKSCNTTGTELPITLARASEVVFAGSSAGALGVLLGIDQLAHQVRQEAASRGNHNVTVRGLVESGFFPEYSSDYPAKMTHHTTPARDEAITNRTIVLNGNSNIDYAKAMRGVFGLANIAAGANPACLHAHRAAGRPMNASQAFSPESNCIFAANLVAHIKTPVFLLQPQFDSWQIPHIYSQAFTAPGVNAYGARLVEQLKYALFEASAAGHGAFVDSCTRHGMGGCMSGYENAWSGKRVMSTNSVNATQLHEYGLEDKGEGREQSRWNAAEAFARWYHHSLQTRQPVRGMVPGLNWYFQDQEFPCTDCCACSPRIATAGPFAPLKTQKQPVP